MRSTKFETKPLFTRQQLTALLLPLIAEQALSVTIGLADTLMVSSVGEAAERARALDEGADDYLMQAREATALPCLRKDFLVDPWQVAESRALGADCILIIMASVDDALAAELEDAARHWGMDALIEVHDRAELDRALQLKSPLIGVNNRNLRSFEISLQTTLDLAPHVPADRDLVCESGLFTPADLNRMADAGIRRFLIGESLMRQADVTRATREILGLAA